LEKYEDHLSDLETEVVSDASDSGTHGAVLVSETDNEQDF
jgi:hypothetical protein